MHDNAFHAYKLSPMFCQLMSTYTDPFTLSSLLASASSDSHLTKNSRLAERAL